MNKKEIIKDLYKKYPRKDAELFERVLIPILQSQKQDLLEKEKKLLERFKLELDVCICDCGEKWSDSDLADLVNQALEDIKQLLK